MLTSRRSRRMWVAGLVLAGMVLFPACGASDDSEASPDISGGLTKAPIKLMTIAAETGPFTYKEIAPAAKAAAKAINDSGGVNGHPIEIISCDDKLTPDGASACGRKAVSENVTAVVGAQCTNGDNYMSVISKAGIPSVANQPVSSLEITSELSFPIDAAVLQYVAAGSLLKATGARTVHFMGPNMPSFSGFVELVSGLLPSLGVDVDGTTLFPVEASDFTQYVASTYGSDADGVIPFLISGATVPGFVNALDAGGYSLNDKPTVVNGPLFRSSLLDDPKLKGRLDGLYMVSAGQTPTDESLPGIKTYHQELADLGGEIDYSTTGLQAWVGTHVIADLLKKASGDPTDPATLIAAMESAGPITYPGWTTFDWSKPALPAPLADAFPRYFNTNTWVSKVEDNELVSATTDEASYTGPITLTTGQ